MALATAIPWRSNRGHSAQPSNTISNESLSSAKRREVVMTRNAFQQFVSRADEQADDGDFNAACSMVYRWWSLLEAPAGTDTSKFREGLVDTNVSVQLP